MVKSVIIFALMYLWCSRFESNVMVCKNQTEITNLTSSQLQHNSYADGESYDCSCSITSATGKPIILSMEVLSSIDCFIITYKNNTEHFHCSNYTNLNYTLEGEGKLILKLAGCQHKSTLTVLLSSQNGDMNLSCHRLYGDTVHNYTTQLSVEETTNVEESALDRKLYVRILGGSIGIAIWIVSVIVLVLCIVRHKDNHSPSSSYRKHSDLRSSSVSHSSTRRSSSVTTITEQIESIPGDV